MNLNYDDIQKQSFPEEVIDNYAFPEDKDFIHNYMRGFQYNSKQELTTIQNKVITDIKLVYILLGVSLSSFCLLLMPGGEIVRRKYDQSLSVPRRYMRRLVPFVSLAIPLMWLRDRMQFHPQYVKN